MKLAITCVESAAPLAPFVLRGAFADSIRLAGQIGFDAVELHIAEPAEVDANAILSACQAAKITVSSIGTGLAFLRDGVTLTHPNGAKREDAAKRIGAFIRLGGQLGCVVIIGLIKGQVRDLGNRTVYEETLTAALQNCLRLAEQEGVTLVLEAVNRYESDILNTIDETVRFIERFGSDRIKVHIDTFHMNTEEDRIGSNILAGGARIGHVHIADSNRRYPGQGHYDFAETISALKQANYAGVLSVECQPLPDPEQAARAACAFLKEATR